MEHLTPIPKPYAGFTWPGSTVLAKKCPRKEGTFRPEGVLVQPLRNSQCRNGTLLNEKGGYGGNLRRHMNDSNRSHGQMKEIMKAATMAIDAGEGAIPLRLKRCDEG